MTKIFLVIFWGIFGILNLCHERITKFNFAIVWSLLMLWLILNASGA
jgi:hypothetical protein